MNLWRRVTDMIAGKPAPPNDERSVNAVRIERLQLAHARAIDRAEDARHRGELLGAYRRVQVGRRT